LARRRKKRKPPVGSRPGTLAVDPHAPRPRIHLIRYSPDGIHEADVDDPAEIRRALATGDTCWFDVLGLGDPRTLEQLGAIFSIHPLALEDVVNVPTRPKAEPYEHNLLIVTRMLQLAGEDDVDSEQYSIVLGRTFVVTFQERPGDCLDPVRERLRGGSRTICRSGPDHLAYVILDTIVDAYFPVIEHVGDALETMEELVLRQPNQAALRRLNHLRNVLVRIRRAVVPQREAVNAMIRDESEFLTASTRLFLRDTYDHCVMSADAVETARELVNGLLNTHLSVVSNRLNEVMKTLTIVTSIFVPLTFLVGVYGMNFDHMPELRWRWSYPILLVLMLGLAGGMVRFFWRKGWIDTGGGDGTDRST
jgi:magnesium transporter